MPELEIIGAGRECPRSQFRGEGVVGTGGRLLQHSSGVLEIHSHMLVALPHAGSRIPKWVRLQGNSEGCWAIRLW